MPHFLIKKEYIKNNMIIIDDLDLYNHIVKSMRAKVGEHLLFLDEDEIQYETIINKIDKQSFSVLIEKSYKSNRKLPLNLYLAQSVLNSEAQISSIKKSVELGVKGIIPLITDNCSVKASVVESKIDKWQKIAVESVKQCERADIPVVFKTSTIKDIVNNYDKVIVFAEKYAQKNFFEYIKGNKPKENESILLIIGPEGGFSESEFDFFKEQNIPLITLGNLIYRADTAIVAALTTVINGVLYV